MNEYGTFSQALEWVKDGFKISRSGWNGKGQFIQLQTPDEHSKMSLPYLYLFSAQGDFVPWVPSQGDLFAEDWMGIE
jgi:hypothetical protein